MDFGRAPIDGMDGPTDRSSMRALTGPVLAVQGKKGTDVDLAKAVKRYVAKNYSESEAAACEEDLQAVQRLRESVVRGKEGNEKARKELEKCVLGDVDVRKTQGEARQTC
mmetsp:Transcript_3237/g.20118  ORF Transcript_3237/g.20118 Transcript_3237/m.20118 type:complete len:110 (-) Transcript_3237:4186-4515(-)